MIEIKQRSPIYISDSANYSADEEELVIDHLDQILASAEQANGPESYIITDPSMFNMNLAFEETPIREKARKVDCWTPMQDLSTSDESEDAIDDTDDGVNSGDTASDEIIREETPKISGMDATYIFDGKDRNQTIDIKEVSKGRLPGVGSDKNFIKRKVTPSSDAYIQGPLPYKRNEVDATRFTLQNQIQTLLHHKLTNGKKIYS